MEKKNIEVTGKHPQEEMTINLRCASMRVDYVSDLASPWVSTPEMKPDCWGPFDIWALHPSMQKMSIGKSMITSFTEQAESILLPKHDAVPIEDCDKMAWLKIEHLGKQHLERCFEVG